MRQTRWMELIKDYEFDINYHPGKANTFADALSRKPRTPKQISKRKKKVVRKMKATLAAARCSFITDLEKLTEFEIPESSAPAVGRVRPAILATLVVESTILSRVIESQQSDPDCVRWRIIALSAEPGEYSVDTSDGLRLRSRVIVPDAEDLRRDILYEAHRAKYTVHPGGTKMYQDLKKQFW